MSCSFLRSLNEISSGNGDRAANSGVRTGDQGTFIFSFPANLYLLNLISGSGDMAFWLAG
jgi:hypothetical protein